LALANCEISTALGVAMTRSTANTLELSPLVGLSPIFITLALIPIVGF
jgi:hypothetical protein